jgi:thymidylate synthase ThyX
MDLSKYISSDGNIFAVTGLPQEVVAVLFAKYSRSSTGLRDTLRGMLEGEELGVVDGGAGPRLTIASDKARKFHEKYVVGFGHASVAEGAVIHMGVENVSILAAKALEDARIGASFIEKSTRYVVFDSGLFVTPPELDHQWSPQLHRQYIDTCRGLIETYLLLSSNIEETLRQRHPRPNNMGDRDYAAMVRARTLDLCRGLLPASTVTNVGITINARAMELLLSKLYSHPALEMRELAMPMHKEARVVAPTLVKYAAHSKWRSTMREPIPMPSAIASTSKYDAYKRGQQTRRHRAMMHADLVHNDAKLRVAEGLLWETNGPSIATCDQLGHDEIDMVIEQSMAARTSHERAPRAFEAINLQIDMLLDFGCFRDLQRHRMVGWLGRELTTQLGFDIPEGLSELGGQYVDRYSSAMLTAESVWQKMREEVGEWAAQYVVPLGYNYHVMANTNLRELFHLIELRSGKGGHVGYRRIAQELHKQAGWNWPWAAKYMRCDHAPYDFAREYA